jgi:hypothetical protein
MKRAADSPLGVAMIVAPMPNQLIRENPMKPNRSRLMALCVAAAVPPALTLSAGAQNITPLKEAKLNIEHNFTDKDTGFQGAIDGEGWRELTVTGPNGTVLEFEASGRLRSLGLTELFFESVEPENAEVPIREVLSRLPEGNYTISGPTADGGVTVGTAWLTHNIPRGPALLSPRDGASVPHADLNMVWGAVDRTIDGKPIKIIAYQLIVERDKPPHPHMIGKRAGLSMYLPSSVTRMKVPKDFLEPGAKYKWEVLAIEPSGNQTLSSAGFRTE